MKRVDQVTISAVMSALPRRRTPEQRKGGPGRPRSGDRCPCGRYGIVSKSAAEESR
jgi:hypothetical protein